MQKAGVIKSPFYFIGIRKKMCESIFIFKRNLYMGKLILNKKYD